MTFFHVIDIETTGLDPQVHKVVEIGCRAISLLDDCWSWEGDFQDMVNPGVPIPPENSAVHHIIDQDVETAPPLEAVVSLGYCDEVDYFVAHNARFEQLFLPPTLGFNKPWICTYRVAAKLWPDAPSHGNQALRYWLKLPVPRDIGMPHRALPDCIVTAEIFKLAMSKATVEEMLVWSNEPVLKRTCTFGKHAGTPWAEVPKDYLRWIVNNGSFDEDTMHTAKHYLQS